MREKVRRAAESFIPILKNAESFVREHHGRRGGKDGLPEEEKKRVVKF